ncbi:glycosyltransferase family 92 protein [Novosphingobium sp. KA1]|uniref:glycosyltransferase family 92 protein n=1 Tax=Novosphingobium sp. (strain KA1) TaxID=164608 RepID=UPI00351C545E
MHPPASGADRACLTDAAPPFSGIFGANAKNAVRNLAHLTTRQLIGNFAFRRIRQSGKNLVRPTAVDSIEIHRVLTNSNNISCCKNKIHKLNFSKIVHYINKITPSSRLSRFLKR